jgi:hypothetical protein
MIGRPISESKSGLTSGEHLRGGLFGNRQLALSFYAASLGKRYKTLLMILFFRDMLRVGYFGAIGYETNRRNR